MKPTATGDLFSLKAATWLLASKIASRIPRINAMVTTSNIRHRFGLLALLAILSFWLSTVALAVPLQNDPNGFEGIPWGAAFSESDTFVKTEDSGRTQTYELKGTS